MKKLTKFLKFSVVGVVWTAVFLHISGWLMLTIWKFDIYYQKQWKVLSEYWNDNGVIAGFSDYMFFIALLTLLIIWLWGWRRLYRTNYLKLLIMPLQYINNYQLRKYERNDTHVVLKNLSVGEKLTVEDVIKERLKKDEIKPAEKVSQNLRKSISEKIIQRKEE